MTNARSYNEELVCGFFLCTPLLHSTVANMIKESCKISSHLHTSSVEIKEIQSQPRCDDHNYMHDSISICNVQQMI